jgi:glycosyltransferase involved in cell wall biosynthesis
MYISDAVEGFLQQNVSFPVEILVGNDGSWDGTEIALNACTSNTNVKIFHHVNNLGQRGINNLIFLLEKARGRYIIICEGDDYWTDPLKLQKQVEFLEQHPEYGGCFHNVGVKYESINETVLYHNEYFTQWNISERSPVISYEDLVKAHLGLVAPTCSLLFRNTPECINYLKNFTIADRVLALIVSIFKGPLYYLPECMAVYRKHDGGSTSRMDYATFESDYIQYYGLVDELTNHNIRKVTNRLRFEVYQACFIEWYRLRDRKQAYRLFKKVLSGVSFKRRDECVMLVKDFGRLFKLVWK